VKLIKLDANDKVADVARVVREEENTQYAIIVTGTYN